MKNRLKKLTLVMLSLLCIFALTGCEQYETKETVIDTAVVACEKGAFRPDQYYTTMANTALARNDFNKYTYYRNLANAMGKYEYHITVQIDGETITFDRYEEYEVGATISVKKIEHYTDGKLEKVEYK